ncbi:MAG: ATP-dependent DNA helicase RecG [Planctomycetota bacterium]
MDRSLTRSVCQLRGVGPALAERLAAANLRTVADLLLWFPRRARDLEDVAAPAPALVGRWVRVLGRVDTVASRWLPGRRNVVTVRFTAEDGTLFEVAFFNQPWLKKAYAVGSPRLVEGLVERRGPRFLLRDAKILPTGATAAAPCQLHYPAIEGVSEQRLKKLLQQALVATDLDAWPVGDLPAVLRAELGGLGAAVHAMHLPENAAQHEEARRRFAVVEAVSLFRRVEQARRQRLAKRGRAIAVTDSVLRTVARALPFEWTADQAAAVESIRGQLAGPAPMGLLLQGDVGTGKTAVAMFAALAVIAAGGQVAFLAPTELLAEQHYGVLSRWLGEVGGTVELLTSSLPAAARRRVDDAMAAGLARLVVGTHALLSERTTFRDLGLVIIDEQHRFGVEQRMRLVQKGRDPHVLVMTATPIPRTLALTLFGDLDVVTLRQRPSGRGPARAVFAARTAWPRVRRAIARRVARGEQVYVVCAKIGEDGGKGGAVRLHADLAQAFDCALVHGRMPAPERQDVTERFRRGEVAVLVGTTVLEVGVDVHNANLMVVVGADRFGLATLHQLRGRVGRGHRRGLCVLFGEDTPRVQVICRTTDGFALAEEDLRLRGAGEFLGTRQSGLDDLRALDPIEDFELLRRVREAVRRERAGADAG